MDLSGLASSPVPNAAGGVLFGLLALVALSKGDRFRWFYLAVGLLFAAAVAVKNISYRNLVVGAEGNLDAHREYASVMFWVVATQVLVCVVTLILAVIAKRERLSWLALMAGYASGYAAVCMAGWHLAYLAPNTNVRYEVWALPLHWVILGALAIAFVMAVTAPIRRPKTPAAT